MKQECETSKEAISQKMIEIEKGYEKARQILHDSFDKCNKLVLDNLKYKTELNEKAADLTKQKIILAQYETQKRQLTLLLKQYREFDSLNNNSIKILNEKYNKKWQQFEKTWYKWKISEISMFLKYKLVTMGKIKHNNSVQIHDIGDAKRSDDSGVDDGHIDWHLFEQNLKQEKFKSKHLQMIDKSELKSFGIVNYQLRNDIYKIIQNLCKNNPIPIEKPHYDNDDGCEGQVLRETTQSHSLTEYNKIDSKYLCPLTRKIMVNPVIAFDEQCYEKEAIISYFRQYKESPITKEKIDDVEWVISLLIENKRLKKEIEKLGFVW